MADAISAQLVVPPSLGDAPQQLHLKANQLIEQLEILRNKLTALEPGWADSDARMAYDGYKVLWDKSAADLFGEGGVLPAISHAMQIVWNNYVEAEGANTRSFNH
jgi:hypothetical protein